MNKPIKLIFYNFTLFKIENNIIYEFYRNKFRPLKSGNKPHFIIPANTPLCMQLTESEEKLKKAIESTKISMMYSKISEQTETNKDVELKDIQKTISDISYNYIIKEYNQRIKKIRKITKFVKENYPEHYI